jgi:hypothetical protein
LERSPQPHLNLLLVGRQFRWNSECRAFTPFWRYTDLFKLGVNAKNTQWVG